MNYTVTMPHQLTLPEKNNGSAFRCAPYCVFVHVFHFSPLHFIYVKRMFKKVGNDSKMSSLIAYQNA